MYRDEDDIMDMLADEYTDWLEENYTALQIEDEDILSFEKWLDNKKQWLADCQADNEFEEYLA